MQGFCEDEVNSSLLWRLNGHKGYSNDRLTVRSVKIMLDGALGSWGSAMLEPFTDAPEKKGLLRFNHEELTKIVCLVGDSRRDRGRGMIYQFQPEPQPQPQPHPFSFLLTLQWAIKGYQVNIHSIGDLANRISLDSFESCSKNLNLTREELANMRFRIEHAQIIVRRKIMREEEQEQEEE